jgi:hypothetical protein
MDRKPPVPMTSREGEHIEPMRKVSDTKVSVLTN